MELERFIPVMTPDELRMFERQVREGEKADFSPTRFNHGGNALISGREKLTPNLQPQPLNQMNYADRRQPKGSTPFFEALYRLKDDGKIRGKQTFTREFDINRWNLNKLEKNLASDIFQPAWLTYIVKEYKVSARWLLTGEGDFYETRTGAKP